MELNTKAIVNEWKEELKEKVSSLKNKPELAIIVAKNYSAASTKYVNNKIKIAEEVGVVSHLYEIEYERRSLDDVLMELSFIVKQLNSMKCVNGVIIQKPFLIFKDSMIDELVDSEKDVDGFSHVQKGKLVSKDWDALCPATAVGIMKMIEFQFDDLRGKNCVIFNRSNLVGIPLQQMLINKDCTVTVIHTKTSKEFVKKAIENADIVVTATGNRAIFNSNDFSKNNKLIIDASMTTKEGYKGVGDIDKEDVLEKLPDIVIASGYGHTGLTTCMALMENVINAYVQQNNMTDKGDIK